MAEWIKVTHNPQSTTYINLDEVAQVRFLESGGAPRAVLYLTATYGQTDATDADPRMLIVTGDAVEVVRDALERRLSSTASGDDSPPTDENAGLAL